MRHALRKVFRDGARSISHYYDPATICFTRWALASCVLLVGFGFYHTKRGTFLLQERAQPLVPTSVRKYEPTSVDLAVAIVTVPLTPESFPDGLPGSLPVTVILSGPLADGWKTKRLDLMVCMPDGTREKLPTAFWETPSKDAPNVAGAFLTGLERSRNYEIDIYICAKKDGADWQEAERLVLKERRMHVLPDPIERHQQNPSHDHPL